MVEIFLHWLGGNFPLMLRRGFSTFETILNGGFFHPLWGDNCLQGRHRAATMGAENLTRLDEPTIASEHGLGFLNRIQMEVGLTSDAGIVERGGIILARVQVGMEPHLEFVPA